MEHTKIATEELELFDSLNDIDVVFDIGARTDLEMIKLKPWATFYLFEPNTDFFLDLQDKCKKLKMGNIILSAFGFGDKEESLPYYIKTQSCTMKIKGENEHIHIAVTTLDAYVKEKGIKKIDYLKIDAEGMDYKILQGGKETLDKVNYLQFEYWEGVKKFVDILPNFNLYLMLEPKINKALHKFLKFSDDLQLIKLDDTLIRIIDEELIPLGVGGNIFGQRK